MEALVVLVQLRVAHHERSEVPFEQAAVLGSIDHQVATLCNRMCFPQEIDGLKRGSKRRDFPFITFQANP